MATRAWRIAKPWPRRVFPAPGDPIDGKVLFALPHGPDSPRAARAAVGDVLIEWGLESVLGDDARLVVSELVTNACQHADGPYHLLMLREDGRVAIEVSDCSPDLPLRPREPGPDSCGGRGIAVVAECAAVVGVTAHPELGTKAVRATFDVPARTREIPAARQGAVAAKSA